MKPETIDEQLDRIAINADAGREARESNLIIKELRKALADMFALIDEGQLVRNTERDHEPDYAIRALMFVRRLAAAKQTLDSM